MATPAAILAGTPPEPDDLVDAVVDRLEALLVAPGLLTRAGVGLASPGQPFPYAVVGEPDEADTNLDTSGDLVADGHLDVTCYAGSKKDARLAGDRVAAALQDAPLAFAAGTLFYLRHESRSAGLDPDPAPGGGDCWQEARVFRFAYSYTYNPPEG